MFRCEELPSANCAAGVLLHARSHGNLYCLDVTFGVLPRNHKWRSLSFCWYSRYQVNFNTESQTTTLFPCRHVSTEIPDSSTLNAVPTGTGNFLGRCIYGYGHVTTKPIIPQKRLEGITSKFNAYSNGLLQSEARNQMRATPLTTIQLSGPRTGLLSAQRNVSVPETCGFDGLVEALTKCRVSLVDPLPRQAGACQSLISIIPR